MTTLAVVIPAYNASAWIADAVRSVLAQTRPADEVIVVDDGSTDDTVGALGELVNRVELIVRPNKGVSAARNAGSALAQSDYIAYLDADDTWKPEKLALIERCIVELDRPGVIIDDFYRVDADGTILPRNSEFYGFFREYGTRREILERAIRALSPTQCMELLVRGFPVYPSALTVRSDVLAEAGGWNETIRRSEDFDLGLRLVSLSSAVVVDEPLTVVRRHEGHGDSHVYAVKALEGDFAVLRTHLGRLRQNPSLARVLGRRFLGLASSLRERGRAAEAREASRIAIGLPGNRLRAAAAWVRARSR